MSEAGSRAVADWERVSPLKGTALLSSKRGSPGPPGPETVLVLEKWEVQQCVQGLMVNNLKTRYGHWHWLVTSHGFWIVRPSSPLAAAKNRRKRWCDLGGPFWKFLLKLTHTDAVARQFHSQVFLERKEACSWKMALRCPRAFAPVPTRAEGRETPKKKPPLRPGE